MSSLRDDVHWIKHELVPLLLADRKHAFDLSGRAAVLCNVEAVRLSTEDGFMLSACYKVSVELAESGNENAATSVIRLVAKITPDISKDEYDNLNFLKQYNNEITAYDQILPTLGWTELFASYYYSCIEDTKCVIVLGDFGVDGWRVCKQLGNLSLEHILLAIRELGKFHGDLYALKHTDRTAIDQFTSRLVESRYCNVQHEMWSQRLRLGPKRAAKAIRSHPEASKLIPDEYLKRLESLMEQPFACLLKMLSPKEPLAIVAHCDYLRNNIAFKYSKDALNNEVPVASMMFDFQTLRYTSPMVDFVTFIANSTGVDVRSQHFDLIFNTYYDTLISHFCAAAKLDEKKVPEYLSRENFLREYAVYLAYGIAIASSFLPFIHSPIAIKMEDFASIKLEDDVKWSYEHGGEVVDRELRALVTEMYELQHRFGVEL